MGGGYPPFTPIYAKDFLTKWISEGGRGGGTPLAEIFHEVVFDGFPLSLLKKFHGDIELKVIFCKNWNATES